MKKHLLLRPIALLAMAVLLVCTLAGCGSSTQADNATAKEAPGATFDEAEIAQEEAAAAETGEAQADSGMGGSPSVTAPQDNRKVILNAYLEMETTELDKTIAAITQAAEKNGGYIASADVRSRNHYTEDGREMRGATYTIKIPSAQYTAFLSAVDEAGNVLSRNESSQDVTSEYVDIESRLKALRAQEARLLELMEAAQNLQDLIVIQDQLTDVQYEIDRFASQKKTYDDLIAYSTVELYLAEVEVVTQTPPARYSEKIGNAFQESWVAFGLFFQELGIVLVYALPVLLVLLVVLVVVLVLVRRSRKKSMAASPAAPGPAQPHYPGWHSTVDPITGQPVQMPYPGGMPQPGPTPPPAGPGSAPAPEQAPPAEENPGNNTPV